MVKTELKTFYIDAYGKPEPLYMPLITDRQFMKSVVNCVMNKVLCKIENSFLSKETKKLKNYTKDSKHSDSYILNIRSNWNEKLTKLPYYNLNLNDGTSTTITPTNRLYRNLLIKSKPTNINEISTKTYGVHLPMKHKDYWKHKHIYESITK